MAALSESPAGSVPAETDHTNGPVPPLTVKGKERRPHLACRRRTEPIDGAAAITIVVDSVSV